MISAYSRVLLSSCAVCLALSLTGCQGGAPTVTKATVAEHVVQEDRSYQSADRQAMLVHFSEIRRQIQRLENKITGLQHDVGDLRTKQADMAATLATAPQVVERTPLPAPKVAPRRPEKAVSKPDRKPSHTTAIPVPAPFTGGPLRVTGVRLGDAPDHTRLVFDASGPVTLKTELDNQEKLLLITLPKSGWDAARSRSFAGDKRLEGYQVMSGTGPDTQVVFTLRAPVTLGSAVALPPNGTRGNRIYIDLK